MFARRNASLSITICKFINKYSNGDKIVLEKNFSYKYCKQTILFP